MQPRPLVLALLGLIGCSARDRAAAPTETVAPVSPAVSPAALLSRVRAASPAFARFGVRRAAPSARLALPARSDDAARIGLDPARTLSIRALDVGSTPAEAVEGAAVFRGAKPGLDLLFAEAGDRFEELRVLHDERAPNVARWSIVASDAIVDVRLSGATVEALDAAGHVVVRTDRVFAVDAAGVTREPALALARGERGWTLTATLERSGLKYPIVLDPIWLYGPSTSSSHSPAKAVRVAGGKVYLAGSGALEVFDPALSSFKPLASMSSGATIRLMFETSAGTLRVLSDAIYTYDPKTDAWTSSAAPTVAFGNSAVALADGRVLSIGGFEGSLVSTKVEAWDPGTSTWSTKAPLATARTEAAVFAGSTGKLVVAGGDDFGTILSTTEIYDVATDKWSAGPALPFAVSGLQPLALPTGKTLLIGGRPDSAVDNLDTILYDPATGLFAKGPKLTGPHGQGAFAVLGSDVFAIGGLSGGESSSGAVEVARLDAAGALGPWAAAGALLVARSNAAAVPLLDGRLLVAGGFGGMSSGATITTTELLSSFAAGAKCVYDAECGSGFCASGVCCATACKGACERCNLAGSEGVCKPAPEKTPCGVLEVSCAGGSLTRPAACDGAATTCPAATPAPCAGGLRCADATSCLTACKVDDDCTTKACDVASGLCVSADAGSSLPDAGPADEDASTKAPVPEGAPKLAGSAIRCNLGSECSSGFCADGVCCDSACKERCHSCALPSSPGRCTESPAGVDLRAECGPALSCSGTCGPGGVCTNNTKDSQCAPSVCTGATTGKGAAYCKARGVACTPEEALPFDCGEYICDPAFGACRTSCVSSSECAPGHLCNVDAKRCEALPPDDGGSCAVSRVGGSGQMLAGLAGLAMVLGLARRRSSRASAR